MEVVPYTFVPKSPRMSGVFSVKIKEGKLFCEFEDKNTVDERSAAYKVMAEILWIIFNKHTDSTLACNNSQCDRATRPFNPQFAYPFISRTCTLNQRASTSNAQYYELRIRPLEERTFIIALDKDGVSPIGIVVLARLPDKYELFAENSDGEERLRILAGEASMLRQWVISLSSFQPVAESNLKMGFAPRSVSTELLHLELAAIFSLEISENIVVCSPKFVENKFVSRVIVLNRSLEVLMTADHPLGKFVLVEQPEEHLVLLQENEAAIVVLRPDLTVAWKLETPHLRLKSVNYVKGVGAVCWNANRSLSFRVCIPGEQNF